MKQETHRVWQVVLGVLTLVMTGLTLYFGHAWSVLKSQQSANVNEGKNASPQVNGNSNILNLSTGTNSQSDDHRTQSPTLNNSPISNNGNGKVVLGGEANSPDNSQARINGNSGKVVVGGNDNSTSITAGTVVFQLWTSTSRFTYPSNGNVTFPANASSKMEAFKELAQTDAFKNAVRPFAALGTLQPELVASFAVMKPDKVSVPKPVSYSKLVDCGALEPDTRGQEALVSVAISRSDNMRPRWPMMSFRSQSWTQDEARRELVQNTQSWINTYHSEMVQVGMLSE